MLVFFFLPILACFIGLLPGGAEFMDEFFWTALGEIAIFQGAADALNQYFTYQGANSQHVFLTIWYIMSKTFAQTLFLGFCVSIAKKLFSKAFIGKGVFSSLIGVAVGLVLLKAMDSAGGMQALLYAVGPIVVMLIGIRIMLDGNVGANSGVAKEFLWDALWGALFSACVVGAVTALMEAPLAVQNGASVKSAILLYLLMVVLMLAMTAIWYITDLD